jgi:hypothetical protein
MGPTAGERTVTVNTVTGEAKTRRDTGKDSEGHRYLDSAGQRD